MYKIVKIEKLDHFGRGIFYDDKICFVSNTLPNEEVKVSLLCDKKKYKEFKLDEIITKSPKRVAPKCPYFNECGGCNLQHLSYEDTLDFKLNTVKEILNKFKIDYPKINIVGNTNPFNYRNKIELRILNNRVGYYKSNSNELIEIDSCLIADKTINEVIKELRKIKLDDCSIIMRTNYNNEILLHFISREKITINRNMFSPDLKIASIILNQKVIFGEDHLIMKVCNYIFKCSYDAFFQINPYMCEKIAKYIENSIPNNKVIADLYCGVGFLGILAAKSAKKVYGIEIVDNAVKDAVINAKINKINNMYFMLGDVAKVFNKIEDEIDCLIVDPPRAGLDSKTLQTVINNKISNILYMSCDPNTLARDLSILQEYYCIKGIKCFDMFSYTYHCESITILERKN